MKKRRKTITPDIGIIADGNIFPLVKDELAKSVLRPMSDDEKDEFYPQLDNRSLKQTSAASRYIPNISIKQVI